MPIDPSIIFQQRPVPSPMDQAIKQASLRQILLNNQAGQQKIQANQMEMDTARQSQEQAAQDMETVKSIFAKNQGDIRKAIPEIMQTLGPRGVPIVKSLVEHIKEQQALRTTELSQLKTEAEIAGTQADSARKVADYQDEQQWIADNPNGGGHFGYLKAKAAAMQAPKGPTEVSPGGTLVDPATGKPIFTAPPKPRESKLLTPEEFKQQQELRAAGRSQISTANAEDIADVVDGIYNGTLTPDISKRSLRERTAIEAGLSRRGFNAAAAERDWKAINRHLTTLNGAQQERLRQAISFTYDSLDVIEKLYGEWQKTGLPSGFKVYNKGALAAAKNLPGDSGAVANTLQAQINDLVSELGTVYKGGNSSTDESLRLASENLKAEWNPETFKKALDIIRTNLRIRKNSIMTSEAVGVTPGSPYKPPMSNSSGATQKPKTASEFLSKYGL